MPAALSNFESVWCAVVAVEIQPGEQLIPTAIAAINLAVAAPVQFGIPKLRGIRRPPYPTGPHTLIVTIDAHLLAGFHLALGWRMPERIIDLRVECHNARQSGRGMVGGLAGALTAMGQQATVGLAEGSSPSQLRRRLDAVCRLLTGCRSILDLGRSLLRGRYLCAVARIEATGIPVDANLIPLFRREWARVLEHVIATIDSAFGVYRGRSLDPQAFSRMLERFGISWPRGARGALDLSDATFKEMARLHPVLLPLKELRSTLIGFNAEALAIGNDNRNRTPLRPFASTTGRNQPSAKASVLGSAAWVRNLIRPTPGTGLAMLDWQQQEFGIAAALSGDHVMQAAYVSGDPYMALAVAARAAPAGSTASSHYHVRERFKLCALGLQYGLGRARLARQLDASESLAAAMMDGHRSMFPRFWAWADAVETCALIDGEVNSAFGWRLPVDATTNPRSIRNFPMQANGAEMLRLACCMMTEAGISVCAPNHDAVMIEAPLYCFADAVAQARRLMAEASQIVLDGFALRTSVRTVTAPDRWTETRGGKIWSAVKMALSEPTCAPA